MPKQRRGRGGDRLALRKAKQIQIMPTNLLTAPQSLLQYCARVAAAAVPKRGEDGEKEREGDSSCCYCYCWPKGNCERVFKVPETVKCQTDADSRLTSVNRR